MHTRKCKKTESILLMNVERLIPTHKWRIKISACTAWIRNWRNFSPVTD